MDTLAVQIKQISADLVELLFNPDQVDLRIGETLTLRERQPSADSSSPRAIIVQVIALRLVSYPDLLREQIESLVGAELAGGPALLDGSTASPRLLFPGMDEAAAPGQAPNGRSYPAEAGNLKIALAKIRKTAPQADGRWEQWDGWIPGRDVEVVRTPDAEVFANATHDRGHKLRLGRTLAGRDFSVEGQDLEKVNIVTGVKGSGKCIVQGTLIPTEHGLLPIEDLCPGWEPGWNILPQALLVQTPNSPQAATAFYAGAEQATSRIRTRFGFTLEGTPEHPVWCMNPDGRDGWRPLAEIRVGDYVAIQRHGALFGNRDDVNDFVPPTLNPHNTTTRMPRLPTHLDEKAGYLLGILVGDGAVGYPPPSGRVDLTSMDPEVVSAFRAWANHVGLAVHQAKKKPCTWYITNVIHRAWLEHLGLARVRSREKVVPHVILRASAPVVRAFLRGLFDTDGSALGAKGIEFATSSERLARQVQLLLLQFGVIARLCWEKGNSWRLSLTGDNARRFYQEIGFRIVRKQKRQSELPAVSNTNVDVVPYFRAALNAETARLLGSYRNYARGHATPSYATLRRMAKVLPEAAERLSAPPYFWDRVEEVTTGHGRVFDLQVPEGHAYVANGFVSHNSHLAKVILLQLVQRGAPCLVFDINREYIHLPKAVVNGDKVEQRGIVHLEAGGNFRLGVRQFGLAPLMTLLNRFGLPEVSALHFENRLAQLWAEAQALERENESVPYVGVEQLIQMAEQGEFGGGSSAMIVNQAIRSRLEALKHTHIFARNSREAASLHESYRLIRGGGALVVDISGLSPLAREGFVQAIIELVKDLCVEEIRRGTHRFPFLFFEEAHLYVSRASIDYIITRARHLGITSFFVTNMIGGLDEAVLRQADNLFLLRIPYEDDIRHVARGAAADAETMSAFVARLRQRHALVIGNATAQYPLLFEVDPLAGINTAGETRFFFD